MKKVHWTTLLLLSGILLAIISMFLVFPSLDQKAITEYKTHYKYVNSEEERDVYGNTYIKEPADDSIPMEYSRIEAYMEPALMRITLLVSTLLFAWSLLLPYTWAAKSGYYRFFTQKLPYEITMGAALLGLYVYKSKGSELVYQMFRLPENFSLDILSADTWQISSYYLLQIAFLGGIFAMVSGCGYAIRSMQHNGVRESLQKHSWLAQNSVLLGRQAKQFYRYIVGFDFHDKGDRHITLRPEGTAPVVRSYVENKLFAPEVQKPVKVYYIGSMFRYERPQAGRLREFHQLGVECFGSKNPATDVETIAMAYQLFNTLGIKDVTLHVNSLVNTECRLAYRQSWIYYLTPMRESFSKDSQRRLDENPLRVLDSKEKEDKVAVENAPSILDYLD